MRQDETQCATAQPISVETPPTGTVKLTFEIEIPAQDIVKHWTKPEAAALIAGDASARRDLCVQAESAARRGAGIWRQLADAEVTLDALS
jgi:hypothetical protein